MEPYKPFRVFESVSTSLPDWNRERLSEESVHLEDIPLQDMNRWVNRSTQERRREVARKGNIVHPMNCFMLYRSAYSERVRVILGASEPGAVSQISISQVTGASWKNESGHIRQQYKALAMIDRKNHETAFPEYNHNSRRPHAAILNGNNFEPSISLHGSLELPNDSGTHLNSDSVSDQFSFAIEVENRFSDSPGTSQAEMLLPDTHLLPTDQQWRNHELLTDLPLNDTITPTSSSVSQEEIISTEASSKYSFGLGPCGLLPTESAGNACHTTQPKYSSCCSLAQSQWHLMESSPCASLNAPSIEKMKGFRDDEMKHLVEPIKRRQLEMTLLEDFDPIMPNVFSDIAQSQPPKSNLGRFLNTTFDSFNAEEDSERPEPMTEYTEKPISEGSSCSETTKTASTERTFDNSTHVDNDAPVTQERPFSCGEPDCKWKFKRRGHLKRHMNIHKGTSLFCWILGCNRSFTRNDNLRAHIKRHMKKGGRNFYVPELGKDSPVFDSAFDGRGDKSTEGHTED